jgi:hypothetical protein
VNLVDSSAWLAYFEDEATADFFAGMVDEYGCGGFTTPYTESEPSKPNITKYSTGAKWARWNGYVQPGIGTIGAYDGGRHYDNGIYRYSLLGNQKNPQRQIIPLTFDAFLMPGCFAIHGWDIFVFFQSNPASKTFRVSVQRCPPSLLKLRFDTKVP